jgi:hypothetical protein
MAPRERLQSSEDAPRRRYREPAPERQQSFERRPQMPSMRDPDSGGSSMGRALRGARSRSASSGE